jgi:hypothetical protein
MGEAKITDLNHYGGRKSKASISIDNIGGGEIKAILQIG